MVSRSHSLSRFFVALTVSALALNWLWEMAQMPAYKEMAGLLWRATIFTCTVATVGDVAMTLSIYAMVSLLTWRWRWPLYGKWKHSLVTALFGALFAVIVEQVATSWGRRSYNDRMPIVPVLDVGLWPLLQMIVLAPLSIRIAVWWARRRAGHRDSGERA